MKKLRGKTRYFTRLESTEKWDKRLNYSSWFNLWHTHFDWEGYGDKSWKIRKGHLEILIKTFDYLKNKLNDVRKDYQIFCLIDLAKGHEDAIYIHTENPYKTQYPFTVKKIIQPNIVGESLKIFLNKTSYNWVAQEIPLDDGIYKNIVLFDPNYGISVLPK